ncbi:MAG: hypothetical protein ACJA2W_002635 [Planctomycetota bacterium]|jgi:hypothetical protein
MTTSCSRRTRSPSVRRKAKSQASAGMGVRETGVRGPRGARRGVGARIPPLVRSRAAHVPNSTPSGTLDGSGLAMVAGGEWAAAKHGGNGRRGWRKLHLGVSASGEIIAQVLTESSVDDGTMGVAIIKTWSRPIRTVTADAAYDTKPILDAAKHGRAEVVVPPSSTASTSTRRRRSKARNRTVRRVREIGRPRWKRESGYHRQGRVENTFYRHKTLIGGRLRARTLQADAKC